MKCTPEQPTCLKWPRTGVVGDMLHACAVCASQAHDFKKKRLLNFHTRTPEKLGLILLAHAAIIAINVVQMFNQKERVTYDVCVCVFSCWQCILPGCTAPHAAAEQAGLCHKFCRRWQRVQESRPTG